MSKAAHGQTMGSALVVVLWCFALLAIVTLSLLRRTQLDLRVAKNHGDAVQAHYLALAGLEKAKALIYEERKKPQQGGRNHTTSLFDNPREFKDVRLGRGRFYVRRQARPDEHSQRLVYGVSDEESKLNVNHVSAEVLVKLSGMTSDVVAAIVDWRDEDNEATPEGAEQDYYTSLRPPYRISNAPLESMREILMIRGVRPESLLGEDSNANGLLDPEEDDGPNSPPLDNADGVLEAGWSSHLTLHSRVRNTNSRGELRVDIKTADEKTLADVDGISADLAKAIVAYRNTKPFESIADLLDVTPVETRQTPRRAAPPDGSRSPGLQPAGGFVRLTEAQRDDRQATAGANTSRNENTEQSGQKLIGIGLLEQIADDLTTESSYELPGRVNINTAGVRVLSCLPGATDEIGQAIAAHRQQNGHFSNIAELLRVPGIDRGIFKELSRLVTVRSETFRILAEGVVPSSGARTRLEAIVRFGPYDVTTLHYRENL